MFDRYPPKSVVVGVDGSAAAIRAAQWAVDEVAGTDVPLRLLHVTRPGATLAAAEDVVRQTYNAVEQMGRPVKVESEIVAGEPVAGLIAASRSTTLLCVGDTGAGMHPNAWLGSTAKELAQSGHCSVAIVRGDRRDTGSVDARWIVALVDESPDGLDVLQLAIHEARHRGAPLRVLRDAAGGDSHLNRCLENYPDIATDTVVLDGAVADYLGEHAADIQLVVVGAAQTSAVEQLLADFDAAALRNTDFSVLVVGFTRPGR